MKVLAVVLGITSTLLVASCTTPVAKEGVGARIFKRPHACQGTGNCDVPVTLVSCGFFRMCPSVPDVILVPKDGNGQRQPVTVVWSAPDGYTFTDQGIVVDEPPDGFRCMRIANGARFQCIDPPNRVFGAYKYTININGFSPVDPWLINE